MSNLNPVLSVPCNKCGILKELTKEYFYWHKTKNKVNGKICKVCKIIQIRSKAKTPDKRDRAVYNKRYRQKQKAKLIAVNIPEINI